jgi:hypothetical protein
MSEATKLIKEMVCRLLEDCVDAPLLATAENGVWAATLWAQLEENGLTSMLADANSETGWCEAFPVIEVAGAYALPLPLPEAIAAGYLLGQAHIEPPSGIFALAGFHPSDTLSLKQGVAGWRVEGVAHRVPWGRSLDRAVAVIEGRIACFAVEECTVSAGSNLAGEPRDTLTFRNSAATVAEAPNAQNARILGAAIRSAQIAGAIAAVLERSVSYATERQQFARPIASFQAIQHQLAVLAEESGAATLAAECAFNALDGEDETEFAVAVAKIRCGEAAGKASAIAHQVHGAMGFAYETDLHHLTRRLLAWRAEFGAESNWAMRVADLAIPCGGEGLWPFIVKNQQGEAL